MKYWKNGVAQTVANGTRPNKANAMAIAGNDVYIAGSEMFPTTSVTGAKVWKNGVGDYLFDEEEESYAAGITIVEDHVFTAGAFVNDNNKHQLYYSIDGKVVKVVSGTKSIAVTGIVVQ